MFNQHCKIFFYHKQNYFYSAKLVIFLGVTDNLQGLDILHSVILVHLRLDFVLRTFIKRPTDNILLD